MTAFSRIVVILIGASPLLLGGIIALINSNWSNRMISRFSDWIDRNYHKYSSAETHGWMSFLLGIFFWLIWKPLHWTNPISHQGLKSGIRIASMLYSLLIILGILYLLLIVAISILVLYLGYKLVMALLDKSPSNDVPKTSNGAPLIQSKKVKSWLEGDHTEHYNEEGKVIYTSKEKEGLLGEKYTEHFGLNGEKFATTSKEKTWYGADYDRTTDRDGNEERHFKQYGVTEHLDNDGHQVASESEHKDFFGNEYTKHHDKDGFVVGTSREQKGIGFFKDRKYIEYRDSDGNVTEIPMKE